MSKQEITLLHKNADDYVVKFTEFVYKQIQYIVDVIKTEVYWCGFVENGVVTQLFIPTQTVSGASTLVDSGAYMELYEALGEEYDTDNIRYFGHSHANMGVFNSGTDLADLKHTASVFKDGMVFDTIHNKKGEVLGNIIDLDRSIQLVGCNIQVGDELTLKEQTDLDAILKARVKVAPVVHKVTPKYQHSGYTVYDNDDYAFNKGKDKKKDKKKGEITDANNKEVYENLLCLSADYISAGCLSDIEEIINYLVEVRKWCKVNEYAWGSAIGALVADYNLLALDIDEFTDLKAEGTMFAWGYLQRCDDVKQTDMPDSAMAIYESIEEYVASASFEYDKEDEVTS